MAQDQETNEWGDSSWLFVETRDGRKGSLRSMEYADPPLAFLRCPNGHYRVEMPDTNGDGPVWLEGQRISCPLCASSALVLHTFWHEPFVWIEWYKECGAGDYVALENDLGGVNLRPASWRPVEPVAE